MSNENLFLVEVSPRLILIDANGQRHPVASPDLASRAIELSDTLKAMGGNNRSKSYVGSQHAPKGHLMLFYTSHTGRASKSEIARAARVIQTSDLTLPESMIVDGEDGRVSGTRAIVYPERRGEKNGAVPFLISRKVWFNQNRVTKNFPAGTNETMVVIDDINRRLMEGFVSLPK